MTRQQHNPKTIRHVYLEQFSLILTKQDTSYAIYFIILAIQYKHEYYVQI